MIADNISDSDDHLDFEEFPYRENENELKHQC